MESLDLKNLIELKKTSRNRAKYFSQPTQGNSLIANDGRLIVSYYNDEIKCYTNPENCHSSINDQIFMEPSSIYSFRSEGSIYKVICVKELGFNIQGNIPVQMLLVGLESLSKYEGAIVIFNPYLGRPIKWIKIPLPVRNLSILKEEKASKNYLEHTVMFSMNGICAIGLKGGQVLLVDLGLDKLSVEICSNSAEFSEYYLKFVDPAEKDILKILSERKDLDSHYFCINKSCTIRRGSYAQGFSPLDVYVMSAKNANIPEFPDRGGQGNVFITAMCFLPKICSIVIGFNFGAFQVWGFKDDEPKFSSTINDNTSISSFLSLQIAGSKEVSYLWVLYSTESTETKYTEAELFEICTSNSNQRRPGGENTNMKRILPIYKRSHNKPVTMSTTSLNPELVFKLILTVRFEDVYSQVQENNEESNELSKHVKTWKKSENLIFVSWKTNETKMIFLWIFDIEKWLYSRRLLSKSLYYDSTMISVSNRELAGSYWSTIQITTNPILNSWDMHIIPKNLKQWINSQFVHPLSYSFEGICLTGTGFFVFKFTGIQEILLDVIKEQGDKLMLEPINLNKFCKEFGLVPAISVMYADIEMNERGEILTSLIEVKRPDVIIGMAEKWSKEIKSVDQDFKENFLTTNFLLDWSHQMISRIGSNLEQNIYQAILDNQVVTESLIKDLNYSTSVLKSLKYVLDKLADLSTLKCKLNIVKQDLSRLYKYYICCMCRWDCTLLVNELAVCPFFQEKDEFLIHFLEVIKENGSLIDSGIVDAIAINLNPKQTELFNDFLRSCRQIPSGVSVNRNAHQFNNSQSIFQDENRTQDNSQNMDFEENHEMNPEFPITINNSSHSTASSSTDSPQDLILNKSNMNRTDNFNNEGTSVNHQNKRPLNCSSIEGENLASNDFKRTRYENQTSFANNENSEPSSEKINDDSEHMDFDDNTRGSSESTSYNSLANEQIKSCQNKDNIEIDSISKTSISSESTSVSRGSSGSGSGEKSSSFTTIAEFRVIDDETTTGSTIESSYECMTKTNDQIKNCQNNDNNNTIRKPSISNETESTSVSEVNSGQNGLESSSSSTIAKFKIILDATFTSSESNETEISNRESHDKDLLPSGGVSVYCRDEYARETIWETPNSSANSLVNNSDAMDKESAAANSEATFKSPIRKNQEIIDKISTPAPNIGKSMEVSAGETPSLVENDSESSYDSSSSWILHMKDARKGIVDEHHRLRKLYKKRNNRSRSSSTDSKCSIDEKYLYIPPPRTNQASSRAVVQSNSSSSRGSTTRGTGRRHHIQASGSRGGPCIGLGLSRTAAPTPTTTPLNAVNNTARRGQSPRYALRKRQGPNLHGPK